MTATRSKERLVSRPFGGLVNLPDRKDMDMRKFFVAISVIAIATLAATAPSQTGFVGGNGGLVNLPGGGGIRSELRLGAQQLYPIDTILVPHEFEPISVSYPEGRTIVVGYYRSSVVQAEIVDSFLVYQATLKASTPGTSYITRWTCRCCNEEQEVKTDCSGSNYQFYSDQHDKAVKVRQTSHPKKPPETYRE